MTHHDTHRTPGGNGASEYRIAHLHERLAREGSGDMGTRLEMRGSTLLVTGTAPSAASRDEILRIVAEELPGVPVHSDIVLSESSAPDRPEDLS
ncbi:MULTISPECIES: hypothetical protein [Streptomyces]|uniref:BON domain-containing protein n=1 Tax=Streptomyces lycii TaxID=2654337 RepID=A0ABQ7FI60_9ACTN|nr:MULTISPECIES: hypothetical protein [Streptomyces]KAF4408686.1 hypothetical protein GCU69_13410 [Streptomyces lycii]PGH47949.1 hypothetical protein CRI70_25720 [Streptomyces sp. Ru87]